MGRKRGTQFKMGSFWRSDDRSGFSVRAENTQQEWQGYIVDQKLWEIRQPQDLVKGVPDDQRVPLPRPIPPATFDGPIYVQTAANVGIGATFIPLQYIAGFGAGDKVGIMTDLGAWFNTTVVSVVPTGINITSPMPSPAASGNMVVDYSDNEAPPT